MSSSIWIFAAALLASGPEVGLAPGARLSLEGQSTLHPYRAQATAFETRLRLAPGADPAADLASLVRAGAMSALEVEVKASALRSGESGLDENMRKALKAERFPALKFQMERYRVAPGDAALHLEIDGILSIAGAQKPVTLRADATAVAGGLRVVGRTELKMTDFGIQPPILMLGMLKTDDQVTVQFDVELLARPLPRQG